MAGVFDFYYFIWKLDAVKGEDERRVYVLCRYKVVCCFLLYYTIKQRGRK